METIPILINHNYKKVIGHFIDGKITMAPGANITVEQLCSAKLGIVPDEFEEIGGVVYVRKAFVVEFSIDKLNPPQGNQKQFFSGEAGLSTLLLCNDCFPGGEELTIGGPISPFPCDNCGRPVKAPDCHHVRLRDVLRNAKVGVEYLRHGPDPVAQAFTTTWAKHEDERIMSGPYGIWRIHNMGGGMEDAGWLNFISGVFPWFPTKRAAENAIEEYKKWLTPMTDGTTYEAREMK